MSWACQKAITLLLITLLFTQSFNNAAEAKTTKPSMIADELIIKYKKKNGSAAVSTDEIKFLSSLLENNQLPKLKRHRKLRKLLKHSLNSEIAMVKLERKLSQSKIKKLISKLNAQHYAGTDYEIEAIYPNYLYEISDVDITSSVPNDPQLASQWALDYVKPEKLWKHTKGEGVTVAVIDTGVDYNHEDLAENIWSNTDEVANNGIDDDGNGFIDDTRGWDFIDDGGINCISGEDCYNEDNDPSDKQGHGTHVAGIIAAVQNNAKGISGIAPKAKVMPVRAGYSVGTSAYLKTSDIIQAVTYAINNDADVINMSFAGGELDALQDILMLADKLGIVLVAAAGNSRSSNQTYPAALPEVIAVGAVADNNTKAYFSNYGDWVDVVAPGSWILSTIPGNQYSYKSGTSMASPIVAGIAALIKAKNKISKPNAEEVRDLITESLIPTAFKVYPESSETIGGITAEINFPLAVDDMVLPFKPLIGETVTLSASASDPVLAINKYEWYSDKDGYLGSEESFQTNTLSYGTHVISVKAQNSAGQWSDPALKVLDVVETRSINPNIADDITYRIRKFKTYLAAGVNSRDLRSVKAYKWVSSVDGTIGKKSTLPIRKLSRGYHKISLFVQDKFGNWSQPSQKVVNI